MNYWELGVVFALMLSSSSVFASDLPSIRMGPTGQNSTFSDPTITVGGDAEETVKPTLAILTLAAVDEKPTAAAAALENAKTSAELVAAVKKLGIADEDIISGSLDLKPQFKDRADPKTQEVLEHRFLGYRAVTNYRLHIHNVEEAPAIARKLLESGTNTYRSLGFAADDSDERFDALRAKAIANAAKRAAIYAREASLQLGEIVQIAPNGIQYWGNPDEADSHEEGEGSQVAISIPPGPSLKPVRASVKVTWRLLPHDAANCAPNSDQK